MESTIKRPHWLMIIKEYLENYYFNETISWFNLVNHINVLLMRREINEIYNLNMSYTLLKKYLIYLINENNKQNKNNEIKDLNLSDLINIFNYRHKINERFDDFKQMLMAFKKPSDLISFWISEINKYLESLQTQIKYFSETKLHVLLKMYLIHIKQYSDYEIRKYYDLETWDDIFV